MEHDFNRSGKSAAFSSDLNNIAAAVRATRKKHGLTQTELAGLSGTGLRFVSELERGKPTVSLNKVLSVLSVLGLGIRIIEKNT